MKTYLALIPIAIALVLSACNDSGNSSRASKTEQLANVNTEFEKGPHGGRLLRAGDLSVEITIAEDGQEPEFHVYPFLNNAPLDPARIQVNIKLIRLGDRMDTFDFKPDGNFLKGDGIVKEPHSFDVFVDATYEGKSHSWTYASYEGRTSISAAAAEQGGVKVETAGPALIKEVIDLPGRITLQPPGRADVRAWYPGRIIEINKNIGDPVVKGEVLVRIEASDTLRTYQITAPISGVITERNANVGDVTAQPIYVIADNTKLQAVLSAFPKDAERLRPGQTVEITGLNGQTVQSKIQTLLPGSDPATQTVSVYASLPNPDGAWRPGMTIEGAVTVGADEVPLAVRARALQRFRDFTVVYARVGDTYEVRMLELGRRTPDWVEVLGGLDPGEIYVSDNAFLIRADVEKSGASHDH